MSNKTKLIIVFSITIVFTACIEKKTEVSKQKATTKAATIPVGKSQESIEGLYVSNECDLTVKITKSKDGYTYHLKTNARKIEGKASFTKNESGEKYLVLEGIKWDEYEGDISNEEDSDSTSTKELEIPIGIDAGYVQDTLTIQNYGNAMNSYTKISECGSKFIQLIKKR